MNDILNVLLDAEYLPPAFSNSWRLGIFFGLLVCYVIGYFNGMKKKSLEIPE